MRGLRGSNPVCFASQAGFCAALLRRCRRLIGQLHKRNFDFWSPKTPFQLSGLRSYTPLCARRRLLLSHAPRRLVCSFRCASLACSAALTLRLVHALIELQDDPVRILEETGQILMWGGLAEASGINLRGCYQDLDPGSLELVMDRAQIVYPP